MDDRRPLGFEDPDSASLWAWLFGRRQAAAARIAPPAQAPRRRPPAAAPQRSSGLTLGWDGSVGAVRARLVVRPDVVDPRAVRAELDGMWRTMLGAIRPGGTGDLPAAGPVVVTVWLHDQQLGPEVRHFLDGVRAEPGDDRIRAVEVQRTPPPTPTWRR